MRIGLDIDGVLADFGTHFLEYLNYEDKMTFEIEVTVTDGSGEVHTESLKIGLNDINEGPTDIIFRPDLSDESNAISGVSSGVKVVGIYASGSDDNLLDGVEDPLITSSDHNYFEQHIIRSRTNFIF